jgi:hypothetical protein
MPVLAHVAPLSFTGAKGNQARVAGVWRGIHSALDLGARKFDELVKS